MFVHKLHPCRRPQQHHVLVERFNASDKAYAIYQKNRDASTRRTRRVKEGVLPLQGRLSHLRASE